MKLVIANSVQVPVKFETNSDGEVKTFKFNLTCNRLTQEEISAITEDKEALIKDVMKSITTGWSKQTLVVDEDNNPVPFGGESFDLMLSLKGIGFIAWQSYLQEVGAKPKN